VTALAVTADGTTALAGLADGTVCVWDIESAQIVEQWQAHGDEITALVFYDTGDGVPRMMTTSVDQTLCLWEVEGGKLVTCFYADSAISAGAAVSDGSAFAAGESTGRVHILRPEG
jgi:WD40 repeat protein